MNLIANVNVLLAQTPPATPEGATSLPGNTVYEFARLSAFDDERLVVLTIVVVAIAIVAVVWRLYRRDAVEQRRPIRIAMMLLRFVALAGLLVFFLGIERRTTKEIVHNSQVIALVDVSQSMGLSEGDSAATNASGTRVEAVVDALADSPLVADLRRTHDVTIARFDENVEPIATLPKIDPLTSQTSPAGSDAVAEEKNSTPPPQAINWKTELQPRGTQTRLGQALADQLRQYRDAPLAGVVVITDGAQNAGVEPGAAVEAARAAKIPLYTIGVGSTQAQQNVALRDMVVPTRAFPNDTLNVTGYVQAEGFAGRSVEVELTRRRAEDPAGSGVPIATEQVVLGDSGGVVPVSFDFEPGEVGTFVYQLRIKPPTDDANARDNHREAEVEVVDRKTRVLLFAGGPMRDYQYLRNQLFRDKTMTVDVLLQTAQPGVSQESNEMLTSFPSTAEELYEYDCIVAFDPDWTKLEADQVELLEKWISAEAGGLIVVGGPIETSKLARSAEHAKIRDLYPVIFQQRLTLLEDGQYGSENPWPLEIERAGREAKFLWLGNTAEESETAWNSFPGVYGYYAVKGEKPGATVYARFSDPEAGISAQRPVYFASQFFGSGQVFYIGSGELWRLRSVDTTYFEVLYTKLIRHVSQGRILRGSSRGSLLVDRDRFELGESVLLRARLSDENHEPLEVESVNAQLLRPDGTTEAVKLAAEVDRPGMYAGQATVLQEGTYQVALTLPGAPDEPLSKYLQVRVPDLERTRAERNEPLLTQLADETGGVYYKTLDSAVRGDDSIKPLAESIDSRAEVKLVKGAPDPQFAQAQMHWLLSIIAGSLFLEWIVRRLNRLA